MLEKNKIYNMDCVEFLESIGENSIDLIVTSCPYNVGIDYDAWNDNMPWEKYLEWCESWIKECYRVLKDDGRMCINHYLNFNDCNKKDQFPLFDFREIQKKIGFHTSKLVIWTDNNISKLTAWGSWMSASSPYIRLPYEGILISYKNQWKKINKGKSTISKEDFIEGVSGVWNLRPETHGYTKANFPVSLPERCINLFTYENDCVIDIFMGSGSTAIASLKTNRDFIGCDISKEYCEIANKRIKDFKVSEENKKVHKLFF